MPDHSEQRATREKRSAALSSVLAAVLLTGLKLAVGLLTGSLGILAEAAHSGLDLVAALVTFFAVRVSDRPPDEQHLYGHGKVENLSALVETLLLLLTCAWIIYEAIQRLFFESVEVEVTIWAFGVMVTSIVVDFSRSRILYRAARAHNSQALEADALHFSTDIWSSSVVILGLFFVWLSERLASRWAWLAQADAVAALIVAVIVVYVSVQLGRRAVAVLLDTAPAGLVDRVRARASGLPGVQSVGPVRLRQAGASTFVDLAVGVDRSISLEEAHQIANAVERGVAELIGRGDVVVHVDPARQPGESLPQTVSAIAARLGLSAHNVHVHEVWGRYYVDLDVEVPPELTLAEAHEHASQLEVAIMHELPYVGRVRTHIEPEAVAVAHSSARPPAGQQEEEQIRRKVEGIVQEVAGLHGCHDLHLRAGADGYDLVLDCLADPALPITEAHRLTEQLQQRLRAEVEGVSTVLVHVEPEGAPPP